MVAKQKFEVTKLTLYGDGKSVRSSLSIMRGRDGRLYIEISDNESGANNRTAKIALSRTRMQLLGQAFSDLAVGDTLSQSAKRGSWNGVTNSVIPDGV